MIPKEAAAQGLAGVSDQVVCVVPGQADFYEAFPDR